MGDRDQPAAKKRILIVEDDENIQQLVSYNLIKEGFLVSCAESGTRAYDLACSQPPDLILLDLMLPEIDGLELCRLLKAHEATLAVPIIMLTAKGDEEDVIQGLNLGADDYIPKPFSPRVLIARIHAVLRRHAGPAAPEDEGKAEVVRIHGITIDQCRHEVQVDGQPVTLTISEFNILAHLALHPGRVFSRQQIIDQIRGYEYLITPRSVDVQVFGLRKKLGAAGATIETIRGIGYRFKE